MVYCFFLQTRLAALRRQLAIDHHNPYPGVIFPLWPEEGDQFIDHDEAVYEFLGMRWVKRVGAPVIE